MNGMVPQRAQIAGRVSSGCCNQGTGKRPFPRTTLPLIRCQGNSSLEFLHDSAISIQIQNAIQKERTLSSCQLFTFQWEIISQHYFTKVYLYTRPWHRHRGYNMELIQI